VDPLLYSKLDPTIPIKSCLKLSKFVISENLFLITQKAESNSSSFTFNWVTPVANTI
jgi:hypothetical protein